MLCYAEATASGTATLGATAGEDAEALEREDSLNFRQHPATQRGLALLERAEASCSSRDGKRAASRAPRVVEATAVRMRRRELRGRKIRIGEDQMTVLEAPRQSAPLAAGNIHRL
jgi:hypothetical protein